MTGKKVVPNQSHTDQGKKPYCKPELISRGDVFALTQGGISNPTDAQVTGIFGGTGTS